MPEDSIIILRLQASAYDEDIAAADPKEVLGKRAELPEDSIIILRLQASAYDEDIAAANPKEILGTKA